MIKDTGLIQSKDFKTGLSTSFNIINPDPNQSPNCMDVSWYFDSVIGKRFGSSTTNTVCITSGGQAAGFTVDSSGSLVQSLSHYWNMDEPSGTRFDSVGTNNLNISNTRDISSITGIRNLAAYFTSNNPTLVSVDSNDPVFNIGTANFSFSYWIYLESLNDGIQPIRRGDTSTNGFRSIIDTNVSFQAWSNSLVVNISSIALNTGQWYNVICWRSNNSHAGISVNNANVVTAPLLGPIASDSSSLEVGFNNGSPRSFRIDEIGFWNKVLDSNDRSNIYNSGIGNTYFNVSISSSDPWYSFDFGASGSRWLTVAIGTGILASSNGGTTFVNIASSRTSTYQYLDRSKNVLIATSDAYDQTLYWAGSAGTFAVALAVNSAPKAKYSINYQGFCILLNSQDSNGIISKRRFSYADENLQLTDLWNNSFDLPSSADDEITSPFILNKFLYVSTKFRIFRLSYTGGNPDWQYIQVKTFGYVPRTVKVFTLKQGQVAVGMDWSRRLRAFDGYDDQIISDNVENDNNYCDFGMQKISLAGSGLIVSNAEFDPIQQEYRLNVAIGVQSTQTTHALLLNSRTLSMYPYSNQMFNTTCVAESAGKQLLMGFDRNGYCHILNSGNLDVSTPINEIYDSPLLFKTSPSEVTKNRQINFFFSKDSSGTIYFQERFDFSNVFSTMRPLRDYQGNTELLGTESSLQLIRTTDITSVQNVYQYRLTSSSGTANPWVLTHYDLFNSGLGYGRGK